MAPTPAPLRHYGRVVLRPFVFFYLYSLWTSPSVPSVCSNAKLHFYTNTVQHLLIWNLQMKYVLIKNIINIPNLFPLSVNYA